MPLYDIYCGCGYEKELILKLNEKPPLCKKCGKEMRIATSRTSFVLKGGGWAKDGYDKNKSQKRDNHV